MSVSRWCGEHQTWEYDEAYVICMDAEEDRLIAETAALRSRNAELEGAIRDVLDVNDQTKSATRNEVRWVSESIESRLRAVLHEEKKSHED